MMTKEQVARLEYLLTLEELTEKQAQELEILEELAYTP